MALDGHRPEPAVTLSASDVEAIADATAGKLVEFIEEREKTFGLDRRNRGLPLQPSDHFFGTSSGNRRDPDRFRDRILARAVERASTNRTDASLPPLPEITPHSLRRTWATFAAMISPGRLTGPAVIFSARSILGL